MSIQTFLQKKRIKRLFMTNKRQKRWSSCPTLAPKAAHTASSTNLAGLHCKATPCIRQKVSKHKHYKKR